MALGPLTMAFVYFAYEHGWDLIERAPNERVAPWIPLAAAILFGLSALRQRNLLYMLMCGFGIAASLREFHFDWTHHGIYYMLLALMFCAWLLRQQIVPLAQQGNFLPCFKATLGTYFLAVLLARRAFRDLLPYEDTVNTQLEETIENLAHGLLLLTSLLVVRLPQPKSLLARNSTVAD